MEPSELLEIIGRNEDSKNQFKANVTNVTSLAQEIVAFSNSGGGYILIGVSDDGTYSGLERHDIGRLNQLLSNASSQLVRPAVNPKSQNIQMPDGLVMVVSIPDGISKPYMDKDGVIWVKCGSDKRKATSREEIQRLYQSACLIHGDEIPVPGLTIADFDVDYFSNFYERNFGETIENSDVPLANLLENMNLLKEGSLNVSGALLFAKNPSFKLPSFIVKAISFPGEDIHEDTYIDSQDITGKLSDVFHKSMSFVLGNIKHIQGVGDVNAPGEFEIPRLALEELIANALIHRDYFISSPVRIFIFSNKIEIISPGTLPNNLNVENIKRGNSNIRNPILASYATRLLPYRGLGSGIVRALKAYPHIAFEDDRDANKFTVIIHRVTNS
ncbi:RNA-binding domain-containing protein [Desulfovibrio inopinatus]|uniref:RNA-binding domain-containing protein n=1 Tax=Desulfovibrio inopinatus TaxID=102109 RepID=UPI0003F9A904|nr:RNA-binding domain-containing protein [Desulfovibrio inopinatus]